MEEGERKIARRIAYGVGVVIAVILVVALMPFSVIDAGERGVVTRLGKINRVLDSGINWRTPLVETVHVFDVRTQTVVFDNDALAHEDEEENANAMGSMGGASKDLQQVTMSLVINWRVIPDRVADVYSRYGSVQGFNHAVVEPIVRDSMKAASANFTAEELIAKRQDFVSFAENRLKEQFESKTDLAIFERVNVTDIDFTASFNQAIEAKVTAEQVALAAKNKLEQVKFEKEQRIAEAQGEAEAIRIQAQAITQQGGEDYVRLKSIEKWDGRLPQNLYGSAPIPFLNLSQ